MSSSVRSLHFHKQFPPSFLEVLARCVRLIFEARLRLTLWWLPLSTQCHCDGYACERNASYACKPTTAVFCKLATPDASCFVVILNAHLEPKRLARLNQRMYDVWMAWSSSSSLFLCPTQMSVRGYMRLKSLVIVAKDSASVQHSAKEIKVVETCSTKYDLCKQVATWQTGQPDQELFSCRYWTAMALYLSVVSIWYSIWYISVVSIQEMLGFLTNVKGCFWKSVPKSVRPI